MKLELEKMRMRAKMKNSNHSNVLEVTHKQQPMRGGRVAVMRVPVREGSPDADEVASGAKVAALGLWRWENSTIKRRA